MKIVVGMSGGVDSAVSAYILKKEGHEVVGATLQLWCDGKLPCWGELLKDKSSKEIEDARMACNIIGIEHRVINVKDIFDKKIVKPFVEDYLKAVTPNPCINCNKFIKWDALIKFADEIGAECIATGHYANIEKLDNGRFTVTNAEETLKDQTYVLYCLTQQQLARTIMPLGKYSKTEVRRIATEIGINVASKADSMDICFIPDNNYVQFIQEYGNMLTDESIEEGFKTGDYIDLEGNKIGTHKGIVNYTYGQRKGLGLSLGEPAFVVSINKARNQVVIGKDKDVYSKKIYLKNVNYMGISADEFDIQDFKLRALGRIRYSHKGAYCTISAEYEKDSSNNEKKATGRLIVEFDLEVRAATPGQSCVIYKDDCLLLGGIIEMENCNEA